MARAAETGPTPAELDFFERRIRPVLVESCYPCHSEQAATQGKLKGGLLLDSRAGTLRGGESGPALVAGKPADSLLLKALRFDGIEMPPAAPLAPAVIADFERWIAHGAADPREAAAAPVRRGMTLEAAESFWSFQPPRRHPLPTVADRDWPRTEVDYFVLEGLHRHQLTPAGDAAPGVLVRRLWFDLVGLPPPADKVAHFSESWRERGADQAIATEVEELLAAPQFGERWGRHWLDVVRYADSNGRDRNVYFYHAFRFRNYILQAWNEDLPFDRLIQEQIAGDLLPAASPEQRDRQLTATAFLALGAKAFEEQKPEIFRMDVIDEQIEVIGRAILGLSVGCARCHDHKFDAIPTRDYYALAGILRSTQPLYGYGPKGIKSNVHTHTELQPIGAQSAALAAGGLQYLQRLQELTLTQNTARSDRYRVQRRLSDAKLKLGRAEVDQQKLAEEIAQYEREIADWNVKVKAAEDALQAAMDSSPPQPEWTLAVRDRPAPEDCRIHVRGDTTNLGNAVPRGFLQAVRLERNLVLPPQASGRRELAEWLTDRANPLTARVLVNRIWQHLFGRGLVATPDDFGVNGLRPSHPELLDNLAVRFQEGGWSTKALIRELVRSRTYRQAATAVDVDGQQTASESPLPSLATDPDNIWLARARPRRLTAESLRDAWLRVAGSLDLNAPAPQQEFLAQYNPYREDEFRAFKPLFLPPQLDRASHRRGVYLPVVRGVLPEMWQLFDFASPERSVSQREESIVPAQSLYLLNSPWLTARAEETADRLLQDPQRNDAERLTALFLATFARPPDDAELSLILRYLDEPEPMTAEQLATSPPAKSNTSERSARRDRWTHVCRSVLTSAEFFLIR